MRFAAVTLTHTLYKMQVRGRENIPEKGPALLIANHVSFVDGLLLSASSSRMIRFLLHEDFYSHPLLHPIFKWLKFIEVPNPKKPKRVKETIEQTKEALRNGDIVCIFPEGELTKNGAIGEFKKGYSIMIPEDMEIPIIPIHLNRVWGSIFTYYYGKIKFRLPKKVPYPVTLTIGKPLSPHISPFALRQKICETAAEGAMEPEQGEKVIHSAFAKLAKRHPFQKTFFDAESDGLSNFTILIRAMLLSSEIRKITKKPHVGILLPNSTHTAVATLAVLMADKVPAMLNFSVSDATLDECISKAEIECILTSKIFIQKAKVSKRNKMVFLEDIAKNISSTDKLKYTLAGLLLPHKLLVKFISPATSEGLFSDAVILFSSGSSGAPKGIVLSHHNINSNVSSLMHIMGWQPSKDSLLGNLPLFHSFGMTTNFSLPMISGTKIVYMPNPLDSAAVGKIIAAHKLTVLLATPTFLQNYIRKSTPEQLKSLRFTIVGAERLRSELSEKFTKMTGKEILEGFGCTELSPVVSINIPRSFMDLETKSGKPKSAGVPIPDVCVKVVHPDTGEDLECGEEGVLMVKGPNVMQRYLKEPEKTAEVIKDGWYNTGDIAKMDSEGYIFITGRLSRFSKIAGEMVPHEVVEQAIADIVKHENRVIAVLGAPDKKKGEKLIVAYSDAAISPEKIITELRKQAAIPNLWIPKKENFIKIDAIPVLGSSKLDLPTLKKVIQIYL
jgi:acyl-[acyl-carrier-protein]-phospholipid O-acyltransferase/long-chain-fatty-acid--[acyl-carrier-protein] ligase